MTDKTLQERLRAEEARMQTLYEYVCTQRGKHHGDAFTDFNQVKHAIAGRDPVLEEAAARLDALEAERDELIITGRDYEKRCEVLVSKIEKMREDTLPIINETIERCAQVAEQDRSWPTGTRQAMDMKAAAIAKAIRALSKEQSQ